jgi:hypothetical protein
MVILFAAKREFNPNKYSAVLFQHYCPRPEASRWEGNQAVPYVFI